MEFSKMYRATPNCWSHSLEVGKPKNGWSGSWQRSWTAAPTNLIARPAAAHPGYPMYPLCATPEEVEYCTMAGPTVGEVFIPGQSGWLDVVLRGSVFPASAQVTTLPPRPGGWGNPTQGCGATPGGKRRTLNLNWTLEGSCSGHYP